MVFATVSDDIIIQLAVGIGVALFVLIFLALLYILWLRYLMMVQERRRKVFIGVWRPLLIASLDTIPESIPPVHKSDWLTLFGLWNHFHESLKGTVKGNLNEIARRAGMCEAAMRLLRDKDVRKQLAAITMLGLMREKSVWEDFKSRIMDAHPALSLAGMKALIRIDEQKAQIFIMPLIGMRKDWPLSRVASVLHEADPHIVCKGLAEAIAYAPEECVPRLVRYVEIMSCDGSFPVLLKVMEKFPTGAVIAACIRAFRAPEMLGIVRENINHPDWYVRLNAVRALGRMGVAGDEDRLIRMLSDQQWWVRFRAAQALISFPFFTAERLKKIRDEHPDRYARDVLAQVIAEHDQI